MPTGLSGGPLKLPHSKLMTLSEAIRRFVADGSSVAMGLSLESLIPFAAAHEIIRQHKRNLTLIGPISDILFDQVIGTGAVRKVCAAWVGNVITGSAYNFRRAVETGTLEMEDHSNLTLAMALRAGAMGVPFMPTRTALGSDLFKTNAGLKTMICPFSGDRLTAVAAVNPDVAVVHVQRADEYGNPLACGNLGVTRDGCMASRHIIITAEEVVSAETIARDPNRVITPGFRVSAVVHHPWGAHPSPVPGYYNRDHQAFIDYRNRSKTPEMFADWQKQWIGAIKNHHDYLNVLGEERQRDLALKHHTRPEAVDYGY
jgi:glutaconate CoA-transferase subunit A